MTILFFVSKTYRPALNNNQQTIYLTRDRGMVCSGPLYIRIASSKLSAEAAAKTARPRVGEQFLKAIEI